MKCQYKIKSEKTTKTLSNCEDFSEELRVDYR